MGMDSSTLITRLETAKTSFQSLERQLADPDVAADPKLLESIARERARLEPLVLDFEALQHVEQEWQEHSAALAPGGWLRSRGRPALRAWKELCCAFGFGEYNATLVESYVLLQVQCWDVK